MNKKKELKMVDYALDYLHKGKSIMPVQEGGKLPLLASWLPYQTHLPTEEEVKKWWERYPNANIALIVGKLSNLTIIDVEEKGLDLIPDLNLPQTLTIQTGRRGRHFYFHYYEVGNRKLIKDKVEIKSTGGYILVPPSKTEEVYKVIDNSEIAPFPSWILDQAKPQKKWEEILKGVPEGTRNEDAASFAGKLLRRYPPWEWEKEAWPILKNWNMTNKPPMSEYELRNVYKSIAGLAINDTRPNENPFENEFIQSGSFEPISLSELMIKEFKTPTWAVEKLVPSESTTAISGAPASYKTWFILDMALKIASGDILFDKFTTTQSGVLIIDEESGERLLQRRFKKLHKSYELPIYFFSLKGFRLSAPVVANIIKVAKKNDVRVIIFDSLVRIHETDENDATKMAGVFRHIKELNKNGLTVIFTHHNRKQGFFKGDPSQNMRGSSDILASVDCHLSLEKKRDEGFVAVNQTKLRQEEEIGPFKLGIINDENSFSFEYLGEIDEVQTKKKNCKELIKEILERQEKPMYKKELFESLRQGGLELGYSTFKTATGEMVEAGELFERHGEKNKMYCSLKPFEETGVGQNSSPV